MSNAAGWLRWLAGLMLLCCASLPVVNAAETATVQAERPKIGLALSGGGARGAAHVGVLRVLEEMRVPIDYIAGTSMGSIIAGLYASGMTPDEIADALKTMDWEHIFNDKPPREERSFHRKRDDDLYLVKAKPGYSDGEIKLPSGLIQGQKFDLALRKLALRASNINDFDRLPIPFRAVASDIGTGESVVLREGDIALAMRASMAVPGAFAATVIDGRTLVDGGITNNLPISVVRDMGADIVIAVDISTPLMKPEDVRNVLKITEQLAGIMTRSNTELQIATLTDRDVLIVPDLLDITSGDFIRAGEAVAAGHVAADKQRADLARLSLSEADYRTHLAARGQPVPTEPVVHFVRVENHSRVADGMISERLHIQEGQPLDTVQLEKDIGNIYGLELFENVGYSVLEEDGRTGVVVTAREKSWGPDYLQFGLALTGDARGDNTYNFGLSYLKTAINPRGGELRFAAQVGSEPLIGVDWYQPLDYTSRYFIEPKALYQTRTFTQYSPSGKKLSQYRVNSSLLELGAGREVSVYGEVRAGYRLASGKIDLEVGDPSLPEGDFDSGSVFGRIWVDRLDEAYFPSRGYNAKVEYELLREDFGNDGDLDQLESNASYFHTFGKHTFGLAGLFNTTLDGDAAIQDRFRLGGFLNLSGYDQDAISGQHSAMIAALYYRRFTQLKLLPWYIGGSLEYGNVWEDRGDMSWDSGIAAGSLFLGADTPIGPLYLGYGHAEQGRNSAFMYLGKTF
jgi:NTE family protein